MGDGSWFHCSKTVVARSAGRSVVAAAAYRTGLSLFDEREQTTHDYTRKHGVAEMFVTTPEGKGDYRWAQDIERLVNAMEKAEKRKDAQVGHEWTIALPAALGDAQQSALSRRISQALSDMYGVAVIAARHEPGREGDSRNDHLHLLFTTREVAEDGALGAKVTAITGIKTGPQEVRRFRSLVADCINEALEDAGADSSELVDARSYADRDIDIEPTVKLGAAATALERRGVPTDRGDINRQIIEDRLAEQDADARDIQDELAARFGDAEPSRPKAQFLRPSQAEYQKLVEEARRNSIPVPADVGAHARMGRTPMDRDMRVAAQDPPPMPSGWLERMRTMAAHLADVWRAEATDHDQGKAGLVLHAARVLKRVLKPEEAEELPPKEEAKPQGFAGRVAGRDILSNERGGAPMTALDDWWSRVREQMGELLLPPDFHSHDRDEPERDIGPDIGRGR